MIFIYSNRSSERFLYTLEVLFTTILGVPYKVVGKSEFQETSNPRLNYSDEELDADISIQPHSLLFENTIQSQDIQVTFYKDIPYFFRTNTISEFQFDLLASSFYMLSRYEEYLPFTPDKHQRFTASASLAYKAGFLEKPVVHLWVEQLKKAILTTHSTYPFPKREYEQLNTIDVDVAFANKGKPFWRKLGGFIKGFMPFNNHTIPKITFPFSSQKDPYDTYKVLERIQKESTWPAIYFFQVGSYGKYDKNLPMHNVMKELIKRVAKYAKIGLHPSYHSNTNSSALKKEYDVLHQIVDEPLQKSRQHYLKLSFPDTFEQLIHIGIKEDYTLGFADGVGFRAGMALPFPFFNLKKNEIRPLQLIPFQIMDGTLQHYLKLSPEKAIEKINIIKQSVRQVNGQLVSIFHNSSVTNKGEWLGWLKVYRTLLS